MKAPRSREQVAADALRAEVERTGGSRRGPASVRITVEDTEAGRVTHVEQTEVRRTTRKERP